jgi:hypothetical protein
MNKLILTVLITLTSLAHADCSTDEYLLDRAHKKVQSDPLNYAAEDTVRIMESSLALCRSWEVEHARRAKLPAPKIGQRKQETSWGNPGKISITTTPKGTLEIQFFPGGYSLMYDNNRLIMIHAVK